jgi:uncharacterized membrane protein YkoI
MNPKRLLLGALVAALVAVGLPGCAFEPPAQAALRARARVGQELAAQAALSHVPGGVIKGGELEDANGSLIWWFDIVTPGSRKVTEVSVDAATGGVISVSTETDE